MKEKIIFNAYPASRWKDATPIGNGRLGGAVYGAVYDERILINHEALYNAPANRDIPDISCALKDLRKLMDEKRYLEADKCYSNLLKEAGYQANKGCFYPAFDLHYILATDGAFTDYSRSLDMRTGICEVRYKENGYQTVRETFVSQKNGYMVLRIEKEQAFDVMFALEPHDVIDMTDYYGNKIETNKEFNSISEDKYVYSACETYGNLKYSGIFSVIETDGVITCNGRDKHKKIDMKGTGSLSNYLKVTNATYITAVLNVSKNCKDFSDWKLDVDKLKDTYSQMKQEQIELFSEIFNRVSLDLCFEENTLSNEQLFLDGYNGNVSIQLIEKMADFGRYLLISSSYGCKLPANLQGLWNGDYSPAWACTFFNNENIEMEYWQALSGNLKETMFPLFDLYDSFKEDYRMNAQKLYGSRGILLPLFMDNQSGKKDNLQPHVLYWTGSSAWIAALYYDYYLFTGDEEFLLNRAYPFMKETALFYEDFLVIDENGKMKSYPSNSPENRANGHFEGAGEISVCINATMDFALIKELLTNLLTTSRAYSLDSDKEKTWEEMVSRIPKYQINEDGAIREWLHEDFKDNYHHRHQSHIYPLFPGYEIMEESDPDLFKALQIAVEKRLVIGLKEQTGWSFVHMANIFIRLCNAKKAKECLDLLLRFCTGANLFTYHNDWRNMGVTLKYMVANQAPFQIDANMGFTSAIYEMLLYANTKLLKFLPALPGEFSKGRIDGLVARGGFTVSIQWTEQIADITVLAIQDREMHVGMKNGTLLECSGTYTESVYGKDFVCIQFKKGVSYKLKFRRNQ